MNRVSKIARAIEPTLIRQLRDQARGTSLDLGIGQPDLAVAEPVREALIANIGAGVAPYSHNLGLWETREAIAAHYDVDAENVMVTCGVQEALAVAILGLVEAGDEVLVPDPGFPAYPNLVRMAGATPVPYRLDPDADFRLVPENVEAALTAKTTAIVINTPSNPTGATHARDDLQEVMALLAENGVRWISDEIYEDYIYEGRHASVLDFVDGLSGGVKLGGLSKSHHMMGWRLGWMIAPAEWVADLKPLHQHLVTCAPTPAQHAAVVALNDHGRLFAPTLATFRARRDLACRLADELDTVDFVGPQGAFYLFLDMRAYTEAAESGLDTSLALAEALLARHDVVTIPGSGFGATGEGFLRIAYTVEESLIEEGFRRIGEFLEQAKVTHD